MATDKQFLYLIGAPATGKSTLLNEALPEALGREDWPFPHLVYPGGIQLGYQREVFSGTDTLAVHIRQDVVRWLSLPEAPNLVCGEGERLGKPAFLKAVEALGYEIHLAYLYASPEVLQARLDQRPDRTPEEQKSFQKRSKTSGELKPQSLRPDPKAIQARATASINLAEQYPNCLRICTDDPKQALEVLYDHSVILRMQEQGLSKEYALTYKDQKAHSLGGRARLKRQGLPSKTCRLAMATKEEPQGGDWQYIELGNGWRVKYNPTLDVVGTTLPS